MKILNFFAQVIAVLFHPLLMLTYMVLLMVIVNPFMFGYRHIAEADELLLMVSLTTVMIPLVAIFVMRGLGWVQSLELTDRHERIGPYVVAAVLYLTLYLHFRKAGVFPPLLMTATLGVIIALFAGFFINNFQKVSMHATAMGGFLTMTVLLCVHHGSRHIVISMGEGAYLEASPLLLLYLVIAIAGMVCTARLITGAHSPSEIYSGFITGVLSMLIAYQVVA